MRYRKQEVAGAPRQVPPRFQSRASPATYIDDQGVLRYVGIDVARYQNGQLLVEGEATNLIRGSNYFFGTGTQWGRGQGGVGSLPVITPGAAVGPDGVSGSASRVQMALNGGTTGTDQSTLIANNVATVVGLPTSGGLWIQSRTGANQIMRLDYNGQTPTSGDGPTIVVTPVWQRFTSTVASPIDNGRRLTLRLRGATGTDQTADVNVFNGQQVIGPAVTSDIVTPVGQTASRAADQFIAGYVDVPVEGDYLFSGNSPFLVDSPEAVAQAVKTRLRLFSGEWFLDDRVGLDLNKILGNNTQSSRDYEVKRRILGTRGVRSIVSYSSQVTPQRRFVVEATVDTDYGYVNITETL